MKVRLGFLDKVVPPPPKGSEAEIDKSGNRVEFAIRRRLIRLLHCVFGGEKVEFRKSEGFQFARRNEFYHTTPSATNGFSMIMSVRS